MKLRAVFLLFAVLGATGLLGSQAALPGAPDLLLVSGRVYTLDAAKPWAEAIAIRGDRIVAVGTNAEIRQAAGPRTRVIDLKGAFVTPGFNDAHVHVESTGALLTGVNLLDVHEPKAFGERIAQAHDAAAGGKLDYPRGLGRLRAVGRRARAGATAAANRGRCRSCRTAS